MFTGSMVAVATPMNDDGSIDFESFEKLIEFHIENKTDALSQLAQLASQLHLITKSIVKLLVLL